MKLNKLRIIQRVMAHYGCKRDEAVAFLKADGNLPFKFKNGKEVNSYGNN